MAGSSSTMATVLVMRRVWARRGPAATAHRETATSRHRVARGAAVGPPAAARQWLHRHGADDAHARNPQAEDVPTDRGACQYTRDGAVVDSSRTPRRNAA